MLNLEGFLFPEQNGEKRPKPHSPHPPAFTPQEDFLKTIKIVNETLDRVIRMETSIRETMDSFISEISSDNVTYKETITNAYNEFLNNVSNEVNEFENSIVNAYDVFVASIQNENQEQRKAYLNFENSVNTKLHEFETNISNLVINKIDSLISNGTLDPLIRQSITSLYGNNLSYKGDGTTEFIQQQTAVNGDVWWSTSDTAFYLFTQKGWVNIGIGFNIDEVKTARDNELNLKDRIEKGEGNLRPFIGIGNGHTQELYVDGSSITIPSTSSLKVVFRNLNFSLLPAQIVEQLPNHATLDSNGNVTIKNTDNSRLVFDTTTETLKFKSSKDIKYTDVEIAWFYYGNMKGAITNAYVFDYIYKNRERLDIPNFAYAYISNDASLEIYENNPVGSSRIVVGSGINVVANGVIHRTSIATLVEKYPNECVMTDDNKLEITLKDGKGLMFNFKTNELEIGQFELSANQKTKFLLFTSNYNNGFGYLKDLYSYKMVRNEKKYWELPMNLNAYIGNRKTLNISEENGYTVISIEESLCLRVGEKRITYLVDDIITLLPKKAKLNNDGLVEITLQDGESLIYNILKDTLEIVYLNQTDRMKYSFVLFHSYYKNGWGALKDTDTRNKIQDYKQYFQYLPDIVPVEVNQAKLEEYASLFINSNNVESFLYFTDPHLCQFNGDSWRKDFDKYMEILKAYYNQSSSNFVICGGDWLGHDEYPWESCYRLGLINATMRDYFKNYRIICGNHDTNYQGKLDSGSERYTGRLSNETMRNLLLPNEENCYYSFTGKNTEFYVLDTQLDTDTTDNDYSNTQLEWFVEKLRQTTATNIVLLPHMVWRTSEKTDICPLMVKILNVANAYNNRHSYAGVSFENAVGKIRFILSGHIHEDYATTLNGIPVISTTHLQEGNTATFDLCFIDYDKNNLNMVRVGTGENRTINI